MRAADLTRINPPLGVCLLVTLTAISSVYSLLAFRHSSFDLFNEHQTPLFTINNRQSVIYSNFPLQSPKNFTRTQVTNRVRDRTGDPHAFHVPIKVMYRPLTQNHCYNTFKTYGWVSLEHITRVDIIMAAQKI